ncbi:uncharacterized protein TNCV_5108471 [Trichonephila clavipes]|nr:uncharacterized protein TNCV_5108471 [Trichonephila clavipes]
MDSTCQQGTVLAGEGSVMVWGVCSWRDMGPLICLDTTLTGDSKTMRHPTCPELQQRGSRSTLLNLDTSTDIQNPQT